MRVIKGWTVSSLVVIESKERRIEDIPADELKEIARRMNIRALRAAGYKEVAIGA